MMRVLARLEVLLLQLSLAFLLRDGRLGRWSSVGVVVWLKARFLCY